MIKLNTILQSIIEQDTKILDKFNINKSKMLGLFTIEEMNTLILLLSNDIDTCQQRLTDEKENE